MKKYIYVSEKIKQDINKNNYTSKLPTEVDISEKYKVSRDTVRMALDQLKKEKIVYSRKGSGYYVNSVESDIPNLLNIHSTITEMIQNANCTAGKLNENMHLVKTDEYQKYFEEKVDFFIIERVRTAEDKLVVFSRIVLPVEYVGENFPLEYRSGSLKLFLADKCSIITPSAISLIEAYQPDVDAIPEEFKEFPIIKLTQENKLQTGKTALLTFDFIRTDIIKIYVKREIQNEI
jgi:DNA-binding GntR family transcriptional regulator